jgi:O-antigen/teichoic acid export membrane protein
VSNYALITVLAVGSSIAIARIYGIDVLGAATIASAGSFALATLSSVREQAGLVRELALCRPREPRVTGLFAAVFAFSGTLTLLVALPVTVGTWLFLDGPVGQPELFGPALLDIASYALITNTGWNLDRVLAAFRAGRELFWVRLHQAVVFQVLAVIGGLVWRDVWMLIAAKVAADFTSLLHRVLVVRGYLRFRVPSGTIRQGFRELPGIVAFGLKLTPGAVAEGITTQAGTWILGATATNAAVGAWNRAWGLVNRLLLLRPRLTEMLFPTLVERRERGDHEGFDRAFLDSIRYAALGMLLPAAAGGGAAPAVMALYGPGFDAASDALALVLLIPAIATVSYIQFNILWADDRPWITTVVSVARMLIAVVLSAVLAAGMGVTGAALGLLLGFTFGLAWGTLITLQQLSRARGALWPVRELLAIPAAFAAGFAAARLSYPLVPGPADVVVGLAAGTVAYLAAALACGAVNERDRARLRALRLGSRLFPFRARARA